MARTPSHPWEPECDRPPRCPEHWLTDEDGFPMPPEGWPPMPCGEPLSDPDGFRARCSQVRYTEHSHHDYTARGAVAAGIATLED